MQKNESELKNEANGPQPILSDDNKIKENVQPISSGSYTKNNSSRKYIIAISILAVITLCLAGYICWDKFINNSSIKSSNTDKTSSSKTVNNDDVIPSSAPSETKVADSLKIINFDKKNCINNDISNADVTRSGSDYINGLSFSINNDEKTVFVQARYDLMKPDEVTTSTPNYLENKNIQFDKKVEDIFIALFADNQYDGSKILFLMDDGSVEYIKYSDIYDSRKYDLKAIDGVEDVVKFENALVSNEFSVFAFKADGSYYDLSKIIK